MKRREFTALIGAAVVWPIPAHAQQRVLPVIGLLSSRSAEESSSVLAAFHWGIGELGYVEGKNVAFQYRWAEGDYDRLPGLSADLVQRQVGVIVTFGGDVAALAAKGATSTIPIVFLNGSDPVANGLVAAFAHPGGNVTGVSAYSGILDAKRVELLHELIPNATVIAAVVNPRLAETKARTAQAEAAARHMGLELHVLSASDASEIDAAFQSLVSQRVAGVIISGDPFFVSRRVQITALAAQYAVPAIYAWREYVTAGGLISYGVSLAGAMREAGIYAGRILNGSKPADLPVLQPGKLELVVNLRAANEQRINIPVKLLVRADEVVE